MLSQHIEDNHPGEWPNANRLCVHEKHWLDEATEIGELRVTSAPLSPHWHFTCCFEICTIHTGVWHKASVQVMIAVIMVLSRQYPFPFCLWRVLFQRHLPTCYFISRHLQTLCLLCMHCFLQSCSADEIYSALKNWLTCVPTYLRPPTPWSWSLGIHSMVMYIEDLFLAPSHWTVVISLCLSVLLGVGFLREGFHLAHFCSLRI